jgi:DNA-binding NarL/FixJ family response regulator
VVVDDHMIVRDGIRMRLDPERIEIVGEAGDGTTGLELIQRLAPDVALVDLRMPGLDGMQLAQRLRDDNSPTRVIIYSGQASPELLERAFEVGAVGYVGKESHRDILASAIEVVLAGERFVDPTIAARLIGRSHVSLSPREQQVLELMGEGLANTVIAERLGLAPETVRHHVSAILRKLDASSRTAAVATAFRRALIS